MTQNDSHAESQILSQTQQQEEEVPQVSMLLDSDDEGHALQPSFIKKKAKKLVLSDDEASGTCPMSSLCTNCKQTAVIFQKCQQSAVVFQKCQQSSVTFQKCKQTGDMGHVPSI